LRARVHDRFLLTDQIAALGRKKLLALIPAFSPRRRCRRNLSCALRAGACRFAVAKPV
jgi:hypothetical protein